jgi:hypothetical protein
MNKNILAAAIAATCAIGVVHIDAGAAEKAKNQALGDLSCLENQIAGFDGELWACIDKPLDGETGPQGPQGDAGPQGQQGEPGPQGPAADGGAPDYQFVDGDGYILGDVVYIESNVTAWGYINDLSTTSTIQVTATYTKSGRQRDRLAGNVKAVRVWYESADCSGAGYLADYELATGYWVQGASEPVPFPHFFTFLETEPAYYLPDTPSHVGPASTWTEVILGSTTGVYDFESYNFTNDVNQCGAYSLPPVTATQIDGYGITIDGPVMPISVVKK